LFELAKYKQENKTPQTNNTEIDEEAIYRILSSQDNVVYTHI